MLKKQVEKTTTMDTHTQHKVTQQQISRCLMMHLFFISSRYSLLSLSKGKQCRKERNREERENSKTKKEMERKIRRVKEDQAIIYVCLAAMFFDPEVTNGFSDITEVMRAVRAGKADGENVHLKTEA